MRYYLFNRNKCHKCAKPARHHGFCFEHFEEHLKKVGERDTRERFMKLVRSGAI